MGDILGFEIDYRPELSADQIVISVEQSDACLCLDDEFFRLAEQNWLTHESICESVLPISIPQPMADRIETDDLPVLYASNRNRNDWFGGDDRELTVGFDLFGSLFFLITRYEEAVSKQRDPHERFPASASITGTPQWINRAIGNEYIECLWHCFQELWPGLQRRPRSFRMLPSHDIDHPSYFWNQSLSTIARKCVGDVIRRRKLTQAVGRFNHWQKYRRGRDYVDPYDQCDWLMKQSERHGLRSAFYFIPIKTHANDPGMPIDDPQVIDQWQRIAARGHEIGYHPGYATYDSAESIQAGADVIRSQLERLGVDQEQLGGRQHVLRWSTSETARYLDAAGLDYDSTLGYADRAGFRCGVCYEYPMYDLQQRRRLKLRQRPLITMDVTLTLPTYMNLGLTGEAYDVIAGLKRTCRKYHGDFTLLWHNTELQTAPQQDFYESLLAA